MNTTLARTSDLPEVLRLLSASRLPIDDLSADRLGSFTVLRRDSQVIGVVGLEHRDQFALLRSLAVSEAERGRGHGKALVVAAESLAKQLETTAIYLLTTDAADFFAGLGYRRISRDEAPEPIRQTSQFSTLCPSSAVLMVKP